MTIKHIFGTALKAGFCLSCLFVAISSLRFLLITINISMAHMAHYLFAAPVPLYAHIVFAPLALALAPFQLWQGLRQSHPVVHRALGYCYVVAVILAGCGSLAMMSNFLGTGFAATGFISMACGWVGFTLWGVHLARSGNHDGHRRFMLRSIALTFGAFTLRMIMIPLIADGWTVVQTYQITAWACWVPNLIAVELWMRSRYSVSH